MHFYSPFLQSRGRVSKTDVDDAPQKTQKPFFNPGGQCQEKPKGEKPYEVYVLIGSAVFHGAEWLWRIALRSPICSITMCAQWYGNINPWTRPYLCQVKQSKARIRCPVNSHAHVNTCPHTSLPGRRSSVWQGNLPWSVHVIFRTNVLRWEFLLEGQTFRFILWLLPSTEQLSAFSIELQHPIKASIR